MRMQGNPMVFDESAGHEIGYLVIGFNDYHILPAFIHLSCNTFSEEVTNALDIYWLEMCMLLFQQPRTYMQ